tara:strand:- start:195 stop:1187 length:993 start_codon:yes stop_codon:yes gene_type:complete
MITIHTKERAKLYIDSCPDKDTHKATISRQFKKDLSEYLIKRNCKDVFLELGTSSGQTTQLLSIVCSRVVTVDNVLSNTQSIGSMGLHNVEALCEDLYSDVNGILVKLYESGPYDIALIDAVHSYKHSLSDAIKSLVLECNVLVFDDIGLFDGVNNAYQRVLEEAQRLGVRCNILPVGKLSGTHAHGEKTFKRSEGVILELLNLSAGDHKLRKQLIMSLSKKETMSPQVRDLCNIKIDEAIDMQMNIVERYIMNSNNVSLIESFKINAAARQKTRDQFRDTVLYEIKAILGSHPESLSDSSLPDILSAIEETVNDLKPAIIAGSKPAIKL